jgi:hypothetical protein
VSIDTGKVKNPCPCAFYALFMSNSHALFFHTIPRKHIENLNLSTHPEEHWREEYIEALLRK